MTEFYHKEITYFKGVGEKRAKCFAKLGVHNAYDLLHFYPRDYISLDSRQIGSILHNEVCTVVGEVCTDVCEHRSRSGPNFYTFAASDGYDIIRIAIFGSKYLAESIKKGNTYFFYGKVSFDSGRASMTPQIIEPYCESLYYLPVYPLTAGLTSKTVSNAVHSVLEAYKETPRPDPIPDSVRRKYHLCHEQFALQAIHFPTNEHDIEIARKRLIFEELFILQCSMLALKYQTQSRTAFYVKDYTSEFVSNLPYELTGAQQRVINECCTDMKSGKPMNRLVQGDVGSGKTVVAASLMFSCAKNGFQSALMAPTEILAKQHYETLCSMMPDEIRIVLLTGSVKAKQKREIKSLLESGEADIVVGTHAVLTDDVAFSSLGLVVTDEQHRFGVNQRAKLRDKSEKPHVLVMSATPIPRTLSMLIYGELDVSIIDELPKGRQKIETMFVSYAYEKRVYNFIRQTIDAGNQAYIVCPLVDENDELTLTSAKEYAESIATKEFSQYNVGLLHGKMKPKEKAKVMEAFADGEVQLLVSTTVIEVGIDVPNATVMYIRDAERFGLSTLHQLRGRVGRGSDKSYCILMSDAKGENAYQRFSIMVKTTDGFKIADADLKLRGPGEFFGEKQSGLPKMKIADFVKDIDVLKEVINASREIFNTDKTLSQHEGLRFFVQNKLASLNNT